MRASPLPNGREKSQVRKSLYLVAAAREMFSLMFSNKLSDLVLFAREEVGWVSLSSEMEAEGAWQGHFSQLSRQSSLHKILTGFGFCIYSRATDSDPRKTQVSCSLERMRASRNQRQPQVRNGAGRLFGPQVGLGQVGVAHRCQVCDSSIA